MSWGAFTVRSDPRESMVVRAFSGRARDALRDAGRGRRLVGLTGGQFSMIDLVRATLVLTGPADVALATWTMGIRDAETAAWLLRDKAIRSLRFMVDERFPLMKPGRCARILRVYGPDCFVLFKTHAKFAVLRNDEWDVLITGSMNLNRNVHVEHFTWEEGGAAPGAFWSFVEDVATHAPRGLSAVALKSPELERAWSDVCARWSDGEAPIGKDDDDFLAGVLDSM